MLINPSNQTNEFESESYRYVRSYLNDSHGNPEVFLGEIPKDQVESILDVGCGNGEFLFALKNHFNATKAVGIEPSQEAIKLLEEKWSNKIAEGCGVSFLNAFAHQIPFDSDAFDLVTIWSVLHWIGRNEYLQSLGELIRVCKKYLLVMDFSAKEDYRVPYKHKQGLYTYKQDFEEVIVASGVMRTIKEVRYYVNPADGKIVIINKSQLEDFGSFVNYHSRKLVIFEKSYDFLPCKEESDFN